MFGPRPGFTSSNADSAHLLAVKRKTVFKDYLAVIYTCYSHVGITFASWTWLRVGNRSVNMNGLVYESGRGCVKLMSLTFFFFSLGCRPI